MKPQTNIQVDCRTTAEAEAALEDGKIPVLFGNVFLSVSVNCRIICASGSRPHVEARGSSQPHVEARGSSQPHVVALESSQPHVVARESSQPHVEASGSCQVQAKGKVRIKAGIFVAIVAIGALPEIEGGGFTRRVILDSSRDWCDHYGAEIRKVDGVDCALVFKGVNDSFRAERRDFLYQPGTAPACDDWDPVPECGHGLHFSPTPLHTHAFCSPKRYVACLVRLDEIVVHPDGDSPQKIKAPRVFAPCWEVDKYGRKVESTEVPV